MMQQQQQPMQGGGGANPMSPQAQWELAKLMSVKDLTAVMQGQSNRVSQSIAMSALPLAMEKATADKGLMASQQLAQNPGSVNSRMLQSQQSQLPENQGIGTLASPNMKQVADVAAGAQGGVVGFAGGGGVQHFLEGGPPQSYARSTTGGTSWYLDPPEYVRDPSVPYYKQVRNPDYPKLQGRSFKSKAEADAAYNMVSKTGEYQPNFVPNAEGLQYASISPTGERRVATPEQTANFMGDSPAAAITPPVSTGRPRREDAPVSASGIKLLQTQPALPMTDLSTSPDVPVSPSAAAKPDTAKPTTADSADGIKALAPVSSFAATQGIMNASTKPYTDEMTETFKSFSLTPDEKSDQKFTRFGTVALSAAKELLASGRPGMSSIGAALGQVGTMAQQYAKEDREDKRASLGAKMSMLGAQVQVAQGNTKSAIEFFNNAEQMAFKDIELRTNTKIRNEELRLKELGIFNENDFRKQTIKYHNDDILERKEWHKANLPLLAAHANYWNAAGAAAKNKGSLTAAKFADITRDATKEVDALFKNPVAMAKLRTAYPGMQDEDIRQQLINTGIRSATSGLAGLDAQRGSGLVDMPEGGKMKSGKALGE